MYKTKYFKGIYFTTDHVNEWLEKNPNILIISADVLANDYIILYKEGNENEMD